MIATAAPNLNYDWSQALSDLGQISPIAALTGFMLFAIVADLAIPRVRRSGVVAMVAVSGYTYSLASAASRWKFACFGLAYHGFATGDSFALFYVFLFAIR